MRLNYINLRALFKEAEQLWPGRTKWILVVLTVFASLLELAGVAVMFKLLLFVIEGEYSIGVVIASLLFFFVKNLIIHKITLYKVDRLQELYKKYSLKLYESYFVRGYSFIKERGAQTLSHNVNSVAYTFVFGYLGTALSTLGDALLILLIIASLIWFGPLVALAQIVIFLPMVIFFISFTGERFKRAGKEDNNAKKRQWRVTVETFKGYPDIAVNNLFGAMREHFKEGIAQISYNRKYTERLKSISGRSLEMGVATVIAVIAVISRALISPEGFGDEVRSIAALFAASTLKLLPSVRMAIHGVNTLKHTEFSLTTIREECIGLSDELKTNIPDKSLTKFRSLELKNISYSFENGEKIIENLSFKIEEGDRVGIKGLSGSGKSTLMLLLLGIYKPNSGTILLNGEDLNSYNPPSWHSLIGYVSQDSFLLDAPLATNIAFGNENDTTGIERVLRMSSLESFCQILNSKQDRGSGEGGVLFSGGERQRVALARALYRPAEVLMLDEATSALDAETEQKILNLLKSLDKTIVVISHKNSVLDICSKVIEIKQDT